MELEEAPLQSKRAEIWNMTGVLFLSLQLVNVYSIYRVCRVSNLQFAAQMQQETTVHLQLVLGDWSATCMFIFLFICFIEQTYISLDSSKGLEGPACCL